MQSWQGKTRGGVLGYKIFVWTLKYPGISFAYFLLYFVVSYYAFASRKAFRSIFSFYRTVLHYNYFRSVVSVFRNYYWFGMVLIDKVALLAGVRLKFTFDFEGEEHLRNMKDGGLLISGHLGNWEIAGQLLNRLEKNINIILFDAEHRQIKGYLSEVLTERRVNFIVIREDFSHLNEIREALGRKEIIAMHGDRYIEGNKVVVLDFLGKPAPFPVGPVNLAARFGVPVSFVFAMKETRRHYHFFATPLQVVENSNNLRKRNEILRETVRSYVAVLENAVRRFPLQWFNYYDFWKIPENKMPGPSLAVREYAE
jgi:predicted LPLAT superfamily acyltransferase